MRALTLHWSAVRNALVEERARVAAAVNIDETAFLPAALEVVERPVSPTARLTARVLLGGLAVMLLWLVLGRTDIVASAAGRVVPSASVKLIQPAENGVVSAILVHDGQRVAKGQPLVMLDPTASAAETEQARKALESAQFDLARGRAILGALDGNGLNLVPPPGSTPDAIATQTELAKARLEEIQASISGHSADQAATAAAVGEARNEAAKLGEMLPLMNQQLAANEKLLKKGYVSKLRVIELRRQRLAAIRDRAIALNTVRRAEAQNVSAGSGLAQGRAAGRATVLSDIVKAEADVKLRREELVKSERRSSLQQLVAPVAGTVAKLSVHTEGGVVEAAKPIMVIVPEGGAFVVEVKLLNQDVGFVEAGQAVAVKLDAFPFTRYGTIPGKIESISTDAVDDERLGPVYVTRIRLARGTIQRGDETVPILPGMSATADIRTGSRSFLSYLLSPIEAATSEAARER